MKKGTMKEAAMAIVKVAIDYSSFEKEAIASVSCNPDGLQGRNSEPCS